MLIRMHPPSVEESLVSEEYRVRQADLNGYGLLHGGRLLTLADETGYLAAHRFSHRDCLTVAVHRTCFYHPATKGDSICLRAMLALTGASSLWTRVEAENTNGEILMDGVFVYAAVDGNRRPVRVGGIQARTATGRELQQAMQQLKTAVQGDKR